jgi:predicted DNA-binding transcriptional regulator AlpA
MLSAADIEAIARMTARIQADRLLKDVDVAEMLAIGKSTVWAHVAKGLIPAPRKLGGSTLWRQSEIQELIRNLEVAA